MVGPNGAGKSTLLTTAAGLHPVAGGRVWWEGREVSRWPAERRKSPRISSIRPFFSLG